jgi:phosphoribosyl-ATP pyrophosphohydrolase/phosphoribosyl-AMP cyclohydrolase
MSTIDIQWDERGLVPAVVYDHLTSAPLMLAWMDQEALSATLETGMVHFHSRSRGRLWKKGESSGNTLRMIELRADCDSDALVVRAQAAGPTCHTGTRSCFFKEVDLDQSTPMLRSEDQGPAGAPAAVVDKVYQVLCQRRDDANPVDSYTRSLLDKGFPTIEGKIREESEELIEVLASGDQSKVIHESADLLFHMLVGLCARGIEVDSIWQELDRRFGTGGHKEKAARSKS